MGTMVKNGNGCIGCSLLPDFPRLCDHCGNFLGQVTERRVTLDLIKVAIQERLSETTLSNVDVKFGSSADKIGDGVLMQVQGFLLGETPEPKHIRHPEDWWQAFKERWFPKWALKRWPVIMSVHEISFKVFYPDFKPKWSEQRAVERIQIWAHPERCEEN